MPADQKTGSPHVMRSPVTREARGRGSTRKTVVIAPPYFQRDWDGCPIKTTESREISLWRHLHSKMQSDRLWHRNQGIPEVVPVRLRVSPTPPRYARVMKISILNGSFLLSIK
jgi:hypothetical protein